MLKNFFFTILNFLLFASYLRVMGVSRISTRLIFAASFGFCRIQPSNYQPGVCLLVLIKST